MDRIYKKIETYLKKEFPKFEIIKTHKLLEETKGVELYGIDKIPLLVKVVGTTVYYKINKPNEFNRT